MWAIGSTGPGPSMRSTGESGFTLIEALVVMAVSVLIAGVAFPSIERLIDYFHFRAATTKVNAALERSRAVALRQDVDVRFAVLGGGRSFALSGEAPTALPGSVRLQQASVRPILFFPDGTSTGGTLRLDAGRRHAAFAITPDTGLIGSSR